MDQSNSQFNVLGLVLDLTWNTTTIIALGTTVVVTLKQWFRDRWRLDAVEKAIRSDQAATESVRADVQTLQRFLTTSGSATSSLNASRISGVEDQLRAQFMQMRVEMNDLKDQMKELKQLVIFHGNSQAKGDGI